MNTKDFSQKLQSERTYLRLLTPDDVTERYCSWLNNVTVTQYLATKKSTIAELQDYVKKRIEDPNCFFYGIFLNETNLHIGNVKLEPINWKKKHAIVGIMIGDTNWQGKGIAPEVLKRITQFCFDELGMNEVELGVQAENVPAIIAYLKSGFMVRKTKKVTEGGITRTDLVMSIKKQ